MRYGYFFMLCILVLLTGCGSISENPSKVADNYFRAIYSGNSKLAYDYLSAADKKARSEEQYIKDPGLELAVNNLGKAFLDRCKYKINDCKIEGNTAKVSVAFTLPDMVKVMGDMVRNTSAAALSGVPTEEMQKIMQSIFENMAKSGTMPMAETQEIQTLVREQGKWKIFLDLESLEKAKKLIEEAKRFEKEKKLSAALEKYQGVLELNSETVKAEYNESKEKVSELKTNIEGFKEKNEYVNKVKVNNLEVGQTEFEGMGIFGEVENTGERSLRKVELTVYFLDSLGKRIYEDTYHPVLVTEWSIGDNKPLKPGYVQKFGFKTNGTPSNWAKKIEAKITDIEFE